MAKADTITQQCTVLSKTISGEYIIVSLQVVGGSVQTLHLTRDQAKGYELGDTATLVLSKK